MRFDLLIKGGFVVDGSGRPLFKADVGISGGKVVAVGNLSRREAREVIDAEGLVVSPGFIDMHSHDDLVFFNDRANTPKVLQGITTVVIGNCGISPAPASPGREDLLRQYVRLLGNLPDDVWRTYGEFLEALEGLEGLGTNVAGLVGHGTLRIAVMGMEARAPTVEEMRLMKEILARSMREGAFGLSTGLIYPPGAYASTNELIELAKVVAREGGLYFTHMRSEGGLIEEALNEALTIGEEAGVPVEISHLKIASRRKWGKVSTILKELEEAREKGIDVTADAYPYNAGATFLSALLPPWALEGGEDAMKRRLASPQERVRIRNYMEGRDDWENFVKEVGWDGILLAYSPTYPELTGKTIEEIASELGKDPYDVVFDVLAVDGFNALMVSFNMLQGDVDKVITHPLVMMGTDGVQPHPRTYGTAPRIIRRYVRELKLLTLEEAIKKMTSMPAKKLKLIERGMIKEGFWADIVVFDPKEISDKATYRKPKEFPAGIKYVIVNGVITVKEGKLTNEFGGKVLKHAQRKQERNI